MILIHCVRLIFKLPFFWDDLLQRVGNLDESVIVPRLIGLIILIITSNVSLTWFCGTTSSVH